MLTITTSVTASAYFAADKPRSTHIHVYHPEDATLVVEMIVGKCEFLAHFAVSVRSSELAQASRSVSTELSITVLPLYSMRNEPSRMTLPSSRAATWYCLAISRTRAS